MVCQNDQIDTPRGHMTRQNLVFHSTHEADPIIYMDTCLPASKVEAPITDKNKGVCIGLGGVIAGNYFSCKNKQILRRIQEKSYSFHEYKHHNKFQSSKVRVNTSSIYKLTPNHPS